MSCKESSRSLYHLLVSFLFSSELRSHYSQTITEEATNYKERL